MVNHFKKNLGVWFVSVIYFCIHLLWIWPGIHASGDWGVFSDATLDDFFNLSNNATWRSSTGWGNAILEPYYFPFYFIRGVFGLFDNAYYLGMLIVYQLPILILTPIGIYLLLKKFFTNEIVVVIASLVYLLNTHFLTLQGEHITIAMTYAFLPITLFFTIRLIETGSQKHVILLSVLAFLMILHEPRMTYITITFFIPSLLYIHSKWRQYLSVVIIIFALSLFWLLPITKMGMGGIAELTSRSVWGGEYQSLLHAITTMRNSWTGTELKIFSLEPVKPFFFILPLLAFGHLLIRNDKKTAQRYVAYFATLIALLGIILAKQQDLPFEDLYEWLYANIPGFNLFRESSKFYILINLSYSYLVGYSLQLCLDKLNDVRKSFVFVIPVFLLLLLFTMTSYPIATGTLTPLFFTKYEQPEYKDFNKLVDNDKSDFRTLIVPASDRWTTATAKHPRMNLSDLHSLYNASGLIYTEQPYYKQVLSVIDRPFTGDYLDVLSVKYLVLLPENRANKENIFDWYGNDKDISIRNQYLQQLDLLPYLHRINTNDEGLIVYENLDYESRIFMFTNLFEYETLQNLAQKNSFVRTNYSVAPLFTLDKKVPNSKALFDIFEHLETWKLSSGTISSVTNSNLGEIVTAYGSSNIQKSNKSQYLYNDNKFSYHNIIQNGTFDTAGWGGQVGDCYNYDENPVLEMNIINRGIKDDDKALELSATRHISCTSQQVPVDGGSTYLISFDHQSPLGLKGRYYLGYENGKSEASWLDSSKEWKNYQHIIKTPDETKVLSVFLYSHPIKEGVTGTNRYDNVSLIKIPELRGVYFAFDKSPLEQLVKPHSITFDLINPTKKLVHIKGATTSFYLAMSESYHPQWQAQFNNEKVNGFFRSWIPWVEPDAISDKHHFELDGFLNGWYIDIDEHCIKKQLCTKNADSSYDMELTLEFTPQRWFYLGFLISGTTLAGCLIFLAYDGTKRWRLRRQKYHLDLRVKNPTPERM